MWDGLGTGASNTGSRRSTRVRTYVFAEAGVGVSAVVPECVPVFSFFDLIEFMLLKL